MDSIALFFEEEEEGNLRIIRKRIRDQSNIFEAPTKQFMKNYRLSKDAFKYLLNEMQHKFKPTVRSTSIPPILKIAAALRFFAEGGYQCGTGQDLNIGMSQSTISVVLSEILDIMELEVCPKWIICEMSEEKRASKSHFFNVTGFPGIIGCVDGTHIKIIAPSQDEHLYFNRKGYHSLNAMIVCDYKMRICSIDARYGGSSHDSLVWSFSDEINNLKTNYENGDRSSWILGDSGYPLQPWLITPYRAASEGSREAIFNTVHSKARNIVERTIGILKSRFRCLYEGRALHYSPFKAVKVINACAALHNICIFFKMDCDHIVLPPESEDDEEEVEIDTGTEERTVAIRIRNNILNSLFS